MIDSFLAEIISFSSSTKEGKIKPLIILKDGTSSQELTAKAIGGVTPKAKDKVLVIAIRNNIDDEKINIYYEASWTNCRIVAVVSGSDYKFTGNYTFVGDLKVDGNLEVTKDLKVDGNLEVTKDLKVDGNLEVAKDLTAKGNLKITKDLTVDGKMTVTKDSEFKGDCKIKGVSFDSFHTAYLSHMHTGNLGLPTSPPL